MRFDIRNELLFRVTTRALACDPILIPANEAVSALDVSVKAPFTTPTADSIDDHVPHRYSEIWCPSYEEGMGLRWLTCRRDSDVADIHALRLGVHE